MDRLELVRIAIQELGDVPNSELAALIERRHGLRIDPKFIPVYKASLRARVHMESVRQAARAALAQPPTPPTPTDAPET